MGQVSLCRLKSTPLEKKFQAPHDTNTLDPCPGIDMVPPVHIIIYPHVHVKFNLYDMLHTSGM